MERMQLFNFNENTSVLSGVSRNNEVIVDPRCIEQIQNINMKHIVLDSELLELRTYGSDACSSMKMNSLTHLVDYQSLNQINEYLSSDDYKMMALRWYKRGLRLDLAIRLAKLKEVQKQVSLERMKQIEPSMDTELEIKRLNNKNRTGPRVTDKELENLILKTYDKFSKMEEAELYSIVNITIGNYIKSSSMNEAVRLDALRWISRGLDPELAIRRAKIKFKTRKKRNTTKPKKPSINDIKNPNIEIYLNAVCERDLISNPNRYLILDTETTGIGLYDEIVQLSIINLCGEIVYSSYFYPKKEVCKEAAEKNNLSKSRLFGSPLWQNEWHKIEPLLRNHEILAHNAKFDMRLIDQTCSKYGINIDFKIEGLCTMAYIKELYGYKALGDAIRVSGIIVDEDKLHDSLYDCQMLLKCLLKKPISKEYYSSFPSYFKKHISNNTELNEQPLVQKVTPTSIPFTQAIPAPQVNPSWMLSEQEIEELDKKIRNSKTQKGKNVVEFVDERCISYIKLLNSYNFVSDIELQSLKTYGRDIVTRTPVEEIESELDPSVVHLIRNSLVNKQHQDSAIRWCKRGLNVNLAIRKNKLYEK